MQMVTPYFPNFQIIPQLADSHSYLKDGQYSYLGDMSLSIRKKEGFRGQRAIVLPKQVIAIQCTPNSVIDQAYITDIGYYPKAVNHYRRRAQGIDQNILIYCVEGRGWLEAGGVKQSIT